MWCRGGGDRAERLVVSGKKTGKGRGMAGGDRLCYQRGGRGNNGEHDSSGYGNDGEHCRETVLCPRIGVADEVILSFLVIAFWLWAEPQFRSTLSSYSFCFT